MGLLKRGWIRTLIIAVVVIGLIVGTGYVLIGVYARGEVQWVYMDEMRQSYFPDYYIAHGKWPTDLEGVRSFLQTRDHLGRGTLMWLEDEEHPSIDVLLNSNGKFAGKLDFHTFLSAHYDVIVEAPTVEDSESRFLQSLQDDYFPEFFSKHHKWPTDLAGVKSYFSAKDTIQNAAILKLADELHPMLAVKTATDKKFEGKINFHCVPAGTLMIRVDAPGVVPDSD